MDSASTRAPGDAANRYRYVKPLRHLEHLGAAGTRVVELLFEQALDHVAGHRARHEHVAKGLHVVQILVGDGPGRSTDAGGLVTMSARSPPRFMNATTAPPRSATLVAASCASATTLPRADSPARFHATNRLPVTEPTTTPAVCSTSAAVLADDPGRRRILADVAGHDLVDRGGANHAAGGGIDLDANAGHHSPIRRGGRHEMRADAAVVEGVGMAGDDHRDVVSEP